MRGDIVTGSSNTIKSQSPRMGQGLASIYLDRSRAPVIRVTLDGAVTDSAFARYLAESDQVLANGEHYALIYDAARHFELSPKQRRLQADWVRLNEAVVGKLCVGAAFVLDTAASRGALTAILWLTKLPFEYVILKSIHEGQAWVRERLQRTGVRIL